MPCRKCEIDYEQTSLAVEEESQERYMLRKAGELIVTEKIRCIEDVAKDCGTEVRLIRKLMPMSGTEHRGAKENFGEWNL